MRTDTELDSLKARVEKKIVLTDYDLGVLNTLKYVKGQPDPYCERAERA